MKNASDRDFAKSVKGHIDLILGGHDHDPLFEPATEDQVCLIKSGYDFQEFSDIRINLNDGTVERQRVLMDVNNYEELRPDADT
jgi:2',3'-cyclic-nucleotide 2'-phosphodiesterase (5'-nucleotidase family)